MQMNGSRIKRTSLRSFNLSDLYVLQQVSLMAYMFFNIVSRTPFRAIPDDQSWENFKDQFTEKFIPSHTLPRSRSSLCFMPLSLNLGRFHQVSWWVGINFDLTIIFEIHHLFFSDCFIQSKGVACFCITWCLRLYHFESLFMKNQSDA